MCELDEFGATTDRTAAFSTCLWCTTLGHSWRPYWTKGPSQAPKLLVPTCSGAIQHDP